MSHAARQAATFARAQAAWDAMEPPEGPSDCPECDGDREIDGEPCFLCGGSGLVDADGYPFDPAQAERDRDEYADYQRGDI
jgi:hypothetical protein